MGTEYQCPHVGLAAGDRVAEEVETGRVRDNPPSSRRNESRPSRHRVCQLTSTMLAKELMAEARAGVEVSDLGGAYLHAGDGLAGGPALDEDQRLLHVKAKRCVERQRPDVVGILREADTAHPPAAPEDGFAEEPTDSTPLHTRIDSRRPDTSNRVALIEEVTADDPPIFLGEDASDQRMVEQGTG